MPAVGEYTRAEIVLRVVVSGSGGLEHRQRVDLAARAQHLVGAARAAAGRRRRVDAAALAAFAARGRDRQQVVEVQQHRAGGRRRGDDRRVEQLEVVEEVRLARRRVDRAQVGQQHDLGVGRRPGREGPGQGLPACHTASLAGTSPVLGAAGAFELDHHRDARGRRVHPCRDRAAGRQRQRRFEHRQREDLATRAQHLVGAARAAAGRAARRRRCPRRLRRRRPVGSRSSKFSSTVAAGGAVASRGVEGLAGSRRRVGVEREVGTWPPRR